MPQVSVIIPAYNVEEYIPEAIDSVLAQTFKDYEIIVVNDGSTDGTHDVLARYADLIRYFRQENRGRGAARNTALRHASGELIAFLDADDYWLETKLQKQVALLGRHPELGFVFAWADAFDPSGKVLRTLGTNFRIEGTEGMDAFEEILQSCPPMSTTMARAACVQEAGMFDERVYRNQDWDLWLRVSLRHKVGFVPEVLACYRLSGSFMPARLAASQVQRTRPYVIRKAFHLAATLPDRSLPSEMRNRALARAHLYGALIDYAVGDIPAARSNLEQAWECDPSLFEDGWKEMVCSLTDFALNLYDTWTPPEEARVFLDVLFSNLPSVLQGLNRLRRATFRMVAAGHGFRAWLQGEPVLARRMLLRAVARYPELARNVGIWSIVLRSSMEGWAAVA
jgi:glycosyltransferase involved in cell wall biosynthesis